MTGPFIVEIWLIDPYEGTQLLFVGPEHPDPSGLPPVQQGNFTVGETVTIEVSYLNVGGAGGCWVDCELDEVSLGEIFESVSSMTWWNEVWTCVPSNGIHIVEAVGYNDSHEEVDREQVSIYPIGGEVGTVLTLNNTPLEQIGGEPILPQTPSLFGTLTRIDTGAALPNETIEVWGAINTTSPLIQIGTLTTDANGNYAGTTDLIYQGYYYYEARFNGHDVIQSSYANLTIDLANVYRPLVYPASPHYCETLEDAYNLPHHWMDLDDTGNSSVSLSSFADSTKPSNQYSIKKQQNLMVDYQWDGASALSFSPGILDMSEWEAIIFSIYNDSWYNPNTGLPYVFHIQLEDINGNWSHSLSFTPSAGQYNELMFYINNFIKAGFDLTKVSRIIIDVEQPVDNNWPKVYYVDWMYFVRNPASYLTFFDTRYESEEASLNLPMTVIAPDGSTWTKRTPFSLVLAQADGTQYTIITEENRFVRWENDETTPTRTYTPTSQNTLIAYYQSIVQYSLVINSSPTGKQIKIGPYVLTTPVPKCVLHLSPGTYHIEVVDTANFLKWENGDTNPARDLVLEGDLTIEAFFSGGNGNGNGDGGDIIPWILLGTGAVIIVAGIIWAKTR